MYICQYFYSSQKLHAFYMHVADSQFVDQITCMLHACNMHVADSLICWSDNMHGTCMLTWMQHACHSTQHTTCTKHAFIMHVTCTLHSAYMQPHGNMHVTCTPFRVGGTTWTFTRQFIDLTVVSSGSPLPAVNGRTEPPPWFYMWSGWKILVCAWCQRITCLYRIGGKFGGINIWRIGFIKHLAKSKFGDFASSN